MRTRVARIGMVAVLALSFHISGRAAHAGPAEDGKAAYNRGDFATALQLLRPLAEQGDASAQNDLGAMYANGQGVPRSLVQAHVSFNIAASGSAIKKEDRDKAVRNRELVAKKMTAAQIAEAQRLAADRKGISP